MAAETQATITVEPAKPDVDLGNYELIRRRLVAQARELAGRAHQLNLRRKQSFGGQELVVIGNERIRTENNCVPRDIVSVGDLLLFGFNVFLGLKTETRVADVLSLHHCVRGEGSAFDLSAVDPGSGGGFLTDTRFLREFGELYEYYKDARLLQLRANETKLLAVFQTGRAINDVRVFRWAIDANDRATYLDNRGERDHVFPPAHDFEWRPATADMHRRGHHPHINILDELFVETVGGDLTVKIEDNTESGQGIYAEPVDDANQSLDDAEIFFARVGTLVLLRILPYREATWRHLVFNTRRKHVVRIDAIGQACVQLPEDHGIVFPGGYYLQTGDYKVFDGDHGKLEFKRSIRSPNGEDVLYVFHRRDSGEYVLYPYNLVAKEVQNPIHSHGYSILDDGRMVVFRNASDEPTRVHPMQLWQTPFVSAEHAAKTPSDGSFLGRIGNADLVRGISDCFTIQRLIEGGEPTRQIYEDLIKAVTRILDAYYWLGSDDVGDLKSVLLEVRQTAELIIDEFEKVQLLRGRAADALAEAQNRHREVVRAIHPERWDRIETFLDTMTALRNLRGHLITLRDVRYIELDRLSELETQAVAEFDRVSAACVTFLLAGGAFAPIEADLDGLLGRIDGVQKAAEAIPIAADLDRLGQGLDLLAEVVGALQVDDATQRTTILEQISEVFARLNRVRAALQSRRKALLTTEGKAEFAAQFKLFGQSVASALALCDTPEKCDEQLSRLMVQLEDLEARFSEYDEFLGELATKREEVYDAIGARKQTLVDERQRRVENLFRAASRIVEGLQRRAGSFKGDDELNTFFAADPMVHKLRQLGTQLLELGDSVKADELLARLKATQQDALRGLRDRLDLFEAGATLIKLGRHRFSVNTQPLELTMVPRDGAMALHLGGTDFYEVLADPAFDATRDFWDQTLVSETPSVYRAEFLAASILFDAEEGAVGLGLNALNEATRAEGGLLDLVRRYAADRYEEGYDRGVHDADAAAILGKLIGLRAAAGLLRFAPHPRALATLYWAFLDDDNDGTRRRLHRKARSLGRLRDTFEKSPALAALARELADRIGAFLQANRIDHVVDELPLAGRYLLEELRQEKPRFVVSAEATALRDALFAHLEKAGSRSALVDDLRELQDDLPGRLELVDAWLGALVDSDTSLHGLRPVVDEAAVLVIAERRVDREASRAMTTAEVTGLLGQHANLQNGALSLRLDEFLSRLSHFRYVRAPGYRAYRALRQALIERERRRLRLSEFVPRVMTSFVRNQLVNDVYLPVIGDNLAKQIGAAGAGKRTDLMGLLLLISPPGYGKTTLMEYVANRLGLIFVKVNGPALGHGVVSFDPNEAPNATSRQEVDKINLAFEMGNNVMLYLDDIQHTHPELLQKFISLCDAQRRVEGVWNGQTRTYDFRGKKFCVVMAGNPYTESGEKFQIPDMLANRADTYNLGDILEGREDAFALSYLENALTSNTALAPIATRDYADIYKLVAMARGEEVASTELSYGYSGVELSEILAILRKLFRVRDVLLKVNLQYIASASMDDAFRTEPRFQLQGSYRNMNKLAEKVVAAMNDRELDALVTDHYVSEAQTLTTGAEHNLLKLHELRGTLSPEQQARWDQIRRDFRRIQVSGGSDGDPVSRVTGTLGALGEQLEHIRGAIGQAAAVAAARSGDDAQHQQTLVPVLEKLDALLQTLAAPRDEGLARELGALASAVRRLEKPQLDVRIDNRAPAGIEELLAQQVAIVERTLVPLVQTTTRNLHDSLALGGRLDALLGLLRQVDGALRAGADPALVRDLVQAAPRESIRDTLQTSPVEKVASPGESDRRREPSPDPTAQNSAGTSTGRKPTPRRG